MSYSKTIIVGNVGRDPEMRYTAGGDPVTNFSIPYDVGYGDNKKTMWVDCSLWGKRAESFNEHVTKGASVLVEGIISLEEFERRDGTRGAKLSMKVSDWSFAGKKVTNGD